jgi:hypothetical protein
VDEVIAEQHEAYQGNDDARDLDKGVAFQRIPVIIQEYRNGDPEKRQEQVHDDPLDG